MKDKLTKAFLSFMLPIVSFLPFSTSTARAQTPSEFQDSSPDLVFIKVTNTGAGVQVLAANGANNFQSVFLNAFSAFPSDPFNGSYSLVDVNRDGFLDLVFIKVANTGAGVQVQAASGADNFQSIILNAFSTLPSDPFNGSYSLVDVNRDGFQDLVFIKVTNTGAGVQVQAANGANNFQSLVLNSFAVLPSDPFNGTYSLVDVNNDGFQDLVFIKASNTGAGVQVQAANGADNFQSLVLNAFSVLPTDPFNGTYSMVDVNGDRIRDLIFIKTSNTGAGVQVFAANGADNFQSIILNAFSALPTDPFNGDYLLTEPVPTRMRIPRPPRCPSPACV
ncbi:MAG: hypothetical protein KME17_09810 [Cyanosarcina radialis HA8281-LM2]|nr:hypothetical protein [Cyanosarcina radialis HA8281-LM2]